MIVSAAQTMVRAGGAAPAADVARRREWVGLLVIVAAFLAVNILTAARAPIVWQDEVMFADPAVNALRGHGLTSTAWPYQRHTETWGGNAPLHTWLLVPWLKVWGVSVTSVRSVNYVYAAIAVTLVWLAMRRCGVVKMPAARLGLVVLLLCEFGISFSYRGGRYDMLGMMWVSAGMLAATIKPGGLRLAAMFGVGVLLPFTGIQLVAMSAVALPVILLVLGWRVWRDVAAAGAGVAAGVAGLFAVLTALGNVHALQAWLSMYGLTVSGRLGRLWDVVGGVLNLEGRDGALRDFSLLPILIVAAIGLVMRRRRPADPLRDRVMLLMLTLAATVPMGMCVGGQFPSYYAWMAALPASIVAVSGAERAWTTGAKKTAYALAVVLAAAAAVGLPGRIVLVFKEWNTRDPGTLAAFVKSHVTSADVVATDYQCFYALDAVGARAYYEYYFRNLTPAEKATVTALVITPSGAKHYFESIGGTWREVAHFQSQSSGMVRTYSATVYRRVEAPAP